MAAAAWVLTLLSLLLAFGGTWAAFAALGLSVEITSGGLPATPSQVAIPVGAVGLATALAVLAAAALLGRRLTAALTRLETAASAYAFGKQPPESFTVAGDDEIARLGQAFAGMVERLDRTYRDLDRSSHSLLANAERLAHVGSAVWDLRSGRQVWSDEFHLMLGLEPGDCLPGPQAFFDRVHPDDRADLVEAIDAAARAGTALVRDFRAVRPDGAERLVNLRADAVRDEAGEVARLDVAIQDITERKPLERRLDALVRELRRSNEELEQFAYVASHDLKQPLRAIGSYVTLLEQELGNGLSEDARQFIEFVRDGVRRMDALIVDLLAYSRVGRLSEEAWVSTRDAAAAAVADLQIEVVQAGAIVDMDQGMPPVVGDAGELERLFRNLIDNAVKYRSPERAPQVSVTVEDLGGEWEFRIADNGIGIPAEHAERVFGIFQRLHARHEYEGTGIGLAICRKIVERHGGAIWLESEPGRGTTVRFTWPKRAVVGVPAA